MRALFSLIAILHCGSASAETCCVDKDIAAAFLYNATYSRGWPATFPVTFDDARFDYIGSYSGHEGRFVSVAWKSDVSPDHALEALLETLVDDEWETIPSHPQSSDSRIRGFISARTLQAVNNQRLCRGNDGVLNIQARASKIGTIASLTHHTQQGVQSCTQLIAEQQLQRHQEPGMRRYLPTLELPKSIAHPAHGGGSHSSGMEHTEASITVKTEMPASDMANHFEPQLIKQQWSLDSRLHGSGITGQVWRREVDGLDLTGLLTIMESNGRLKLRFSVDS